MTSNLIDHAKVFLTPALIVLSYGQRLKLIFVYFKLVMVKSSAKLVKKCELRSGLSQRHIAATCRGYKSLLLYR